MPLDATNNIDDSNYPSSFCIVGHTDAVLPFNVMEPFRRKVKVELAWIRSGPR
jgi:hypothetical protein